MEIRVERHNSRDLFKEQLGEECFQDQISGCFSPLMMHGVFLVVSQPFPRKDPGLECPSQVGVSRMDGRHLASRHLLRLEGFGDFMGVLG